MARHRNNRKGKKLRNYGGNGDLGMSKHRSSGANKTNRRVRLGWELELARRRALLAQAAKVEMFDMVEELMEAERGR